VPGGLNTHVQFNDNGDFGGSANFTFNKTTNVLALAGSQTITPGTDVTNLTLRANATTTSVKTLVLQDNNGIEWGYFRKRILSDANIGFELNFNTSGTGATARNGLLITLNAGYTGAEFTGALAFDNAVAGTATYYTADQTVYGYRASGNRGFGGFARGVTTGHNIGGMVLAGGGAINYALWASATISKSSAINVGVFGNAYNATATAPAYIGGYFTIYNSSTAPPNMTGVKTALLADNQTFAADIILARDNGSTVFLVADQGATSVTPVATAGGVTAFTIFPGAHTAVTSEKRSLYVRGNTVTITGSFSEQGTNVFDGQTFDAATLQTITTSSTVIINGAPSTTGSAVITNPYALWVKSGSSRFDGRILGTSAAVTAANDLTLGAANEFLVSGNTQINAIITAGWRAGSQVTLIFSGTPTVKHNTAGGAGTAVMLLQGSVDLTAAANTVLCLEYDGTSWQETSRKTA